MMQINEQKCTKCGHIWLPRKEGRPVQCPFCKSVKWDAVRQDSKIIKRRENDRTN